MGVQTGGHAVASPVQILVKYGCRCSCKSMELRWITRRMSGNSKTSNPFERGASKFKSPSMVPIYVSTDAKDINHQSLKDLYKICDHSCHRFPKLNPKDCSVVDESIDINKLRVALSHSFVLVSIFCRPNDVNWDGNSMDSLYPDEDFPNGGKMESGAGPLRGLLQRVAPVTPSSGQLVGFGRAVSDHGLTAAIYDVMVIPSLRRMGIGKLIVNRIVRKLAGRDIYDIGALCSDQDRSFFKACGFGDDTLGSTTMIYPNESSCL